MFKVCVCDDFGRLGIRAIKKCHKGSKRLKDCLKSPSRPKETHYIEPANDFTKLTTTRYMSNE